MRTRKEPEQRKQEIFAAAVQLFMEKGYAATTVADITKAAGVAKGTFFYYFATKDVLLEAIGRRWAEASAAFWVCTRCVIRRSTPNSPSAFRCFWRFRLLPPLW